MTKNNIVFCFHVLRNLFYLWEKWCPIFIKSRRGNCLRKLPTLANLVNKLQINSNCTELCGNFRGKSCARIVPVYVYLDSQPENSVLTYAMLDDQSITTLAKSFRFGSLGIKSFPLEHTIQSCSERTIGHGRIADQLIVKKLSGKVQLELPPVLK